MVHVKIMYPEDMKQLPYTISKPNNGPDKTFKVKVIITRSKVKMVLQ